MPCTDLLSHRLWAYKRGPSKLINVRAACPKAAEWIDTLPRSRCYQAHDWQRLAKKSRCCIADGMALPDIIIRGDCNRYGDASEAQEQGSGWRWASILCEEYQPRKLTPTLLLTGSGGSDQATKGARTTSPSPIHKQPYAAVLVPGRRIFDTTVMRCGRTSATLGLEGSG